jgi:hypothetical protein
MIMKDFLRILEGRLPPSTTREDSKSSMLLTYTWCIILFKKIYLKERERERERERLGFLF